MEDKIIFSFDNENYEVGMDAYNKNKDIMLPSGITIQVEKWIETLPPQIDAYKVIAETTSDKVIYATKGSEVTIKMFPKINFSFENEDYIVDMVVCDKNKNIQLPDGRVLSVNGWIESYPPYPESLNLVENPDYSKTILAQLANPTHKLKM